MTPLCLISWALVIFLVYRFSQSIKENDSLKEYIHELRTDAEGYVQHIRRSADDYYAKRLHKADTYYWGKIKQIKETMDLVAAEEQLLKEKESLVKIFLATKIMDFPLVATVISDYETAKDKQLADMLEMKKPRASKAADEVRIIRKEKRKLIEENKAYKWELNQLRNLLPWLIDWENTPIAPTTQTRNQQYTDSSETGYWLSPDEYAYLTDMEKSQLALDRYMKRNKTNAEIGREYERYIGYLYEMENFRVEYYGAKKGLEDFGRDLICIKDSRIHIVQCKCWSALKGKVIHENHINQLYGTTIAYKIENILGKRLEELTDEDFNPLSMACIDSLDIQPVFFSTVEYSLAAKSFATCLGIDCRIRPFEPHPMIKCNIGKEGERIYHLPFDQQYDRCRIDLRLGECYVETVKGAEEKGFRRAQRWAGNKSATPKRID